MLDIPVSVDLQLFSAGGFLSRQQNRIIAPMSKQAFFIGEAFSGLGNFDGTLRLSSGNAFVATALRFEEGRFASLNPRATSGSMGLFNIGGTYDFAQTFTTVVGNQEVSRTERFLLEITQTAGFIPGLTTSSIRFLDRFTRSPLTDKTVFDLRFVGGLLTGALLNLEGASSAWSFSYFELRYNSATRGFQGSYNRIWCLRDLTGRWGSGPQRHSRYVQ